MKSIRVLFVAAAVTFPVYVFAQQAIEDQAVRQNQMSIQPETYGTGSLTWQSFSAWDFHPLDSATTYSYALSPRFGLYPTAGSLFEAPLHLPEGAIVSTLDMTVRFERRRRADHRYCNRPDQFFHHHSHGYLNDGINLCFGLCEFHSRDHPVHRR